MKKIFIFIYICICTACSTLAPKQDFPRAKVKDIVIGKTTQREMYNSFGMPLYHGSRSKDEAWWMYIRTTEGNSESLSLYFDKEGRVADYLYTPFEKSLNEKRRASK